MFCQSDCNLNQTTAFRITFYSMALEVTLQNTNFVWRQKSKFEVAIQLPIWQLSLKEETNIHREGQALHRDITQLIHTETTPTCGSKELKYRFINILNVSDIPNWAIQRFILITALN